MGIVTEIVGELVYCIESVSAALMASSKLIKRKHFVLRAILCLLAVFLVSFSYRKMFGLFRYDSVETYVLLTIDILLVFVLSMVSVAVCCECNVWSAMFCGIVGYCLQHISYRIFISIMLLAGARLNIFLEACIRIAMSGTLYFVIWWFVVRKTDHRTIMEENKSQIIVALTVVMITNVLFVFSNYIMAEYTKMGKICMYAFSVIAVACILVMQFGLLKVTGMRRQRDFFRQIMDRKEEQYDMEKTVVDTINIKCHDLKKIISVLDGRIASMDLDNIRQAVDSYGTIYHTGNAALDIVLSMKSMYCENRGIVLTCVADGKKLAFVDELDIYSLFCNILDNAIRAVEAIDVPNKRLISLTVDENKGFVVIRCDNYFKGKITLVAGLPQTTKADKINHGYGLLSIKAITEKYSGQMDISTEDDIFTCECIFPLTDTEAKKP